MTRAVLVAVDWRREDPAPLALGLRLARIVGAPLLLAAVCPEARHTEAEEALRRAEAQLRDVGGSIPPIERRAIAATGTPAAALQELAAGEPPLLMVIGSSARGDLGRVSPGAVTGSPSIATLPEVAGMSPAMIRSNVDLPQPERPSSATISLSHRVRFTSSSTAWSPAPPWR